MINQLLLILGECLVSFRLKRIVLTTRSSTLTLTLRLISISTITLSLVTVARHFLRLLTLTLTTPILGGITPTLSGLLKVTFNLSNLLLLLLLSVSENLASNFYNLVKGFCSSKLIDDYFLFSIPLKDFTSMNTDLKEEIHTVNQSIRIEATLTNAEEIFIMQLTVTAVEVTSKTRKLTLHQFLNASIFAHIQIRLRNAVVITPAVGGIDGMTDFMPDEHIVYVGGCLLPHRQGQHTVFHVKHRRLNRAVLYDKILGGEQASEVALDFDV